MSKIVYIAHPVGGDVDGNIKKILAIVRTINLTEPHVVPLVPYLADIMAMDDNNPIERERGIKNDIAVINSGMVTELRLYGNRLSAGMAEEKKAAERLGIPVISYIV